MYWAIVWFNNTLVDLLRCGDHAGTTPENIFSTVPPQKNLRSTLEPHVFLHVPFFRHLQDSIRSFCFRCTSLLFKSSIDIVCQIRDDLGISIHTISCIFVNK